MSTISSTKTNKSSNNSRSSMVCPSISGVSSENGSTGAKRIGNKIQELIPKKLHGQEWLVAGYNKHKSTYSLPAISLLPGRYRYFQYSSTVSRFSPPRLCRKGNASPFRFTHVCFSHLCPQTRFAPSLRHLGSCRSTSATPSTRGDKDIISTRRNRGYPKSNSKTYVPAFHLYVTIRQSSWSRELFISRKRTPSRTQTIDPIGNVPTRSNSAEYCRSRTVAFVMFRHDTTAH